MNTKTGLTVLAITASLFAATACGSETAQPTAHRQGAAAQLSSAHAAQDAYLSWLAQRARAAKAQHATCRISPRVVEQWAPGAVRLPTCAAVRTKPQQHFGDDRRTPR